MKPKLSFDQSAIQDGDVICFQVDIPDKESVLFSLPSCVTHRSPGSMIWSVKDSIPTPPSSMTFCRTES